MAGKAEEELHVAFFPLMAYGHMIPTLDMVRLFTAHSGVKATIITTTFNASAFSRAIQSKGDSASNIQIQALRFPAQQVGLPEGHENLQQVHGPQSINNFYKAAHMLSEQLEQFLDKVKPNCLVADMFFPWATESAAKFNIPRLVFHGISNFALCAQEIIRTREPHMQVSSDNEPFLLPSLPHEVYMTRLQLPEYLRLNNEETDFHKRWVGAMKSELESFGVIINSFYELEPTYIDFFRNELGRRSWNIGPVSLINKTTQDKAQRGKQASLDEHECLKWLNSKKSNSVIYICFGSKSCFIAPQLHEIAMALETTGQEFIWVVNNIDGIGDEEDWSFLQGFEQRTQRKGLIIRGWAPQVLILEHEAVGAFVTHCGWNSILEATSAGVPMVTWPIYSEQFYNEKLVTQILKIGIPIGVKKWNRKLSIEDVIKKEAIEIALTEILVGKEAEDRRSRVNNLKEGAQKAIQQCGSSHSDLSALIYKLRNYHQD